MTKETELATTGETGLSLNYGEEVGEGFEGAEEHLSIPWLGILQSGSPQCDPNDGLDGARPGMLHNSVTNELMDHVIFQPVFQDQWYVEWIPREQGGGFVDRYDAKSDTVKKARANHEGRFGKLATDDGNDLVETFYAYGVLLDEDGETAIGLAVVAFKSTQIKPFRNWLTSMYTLLVGPEGSRRKPPIYAHRVKIGTVNQTNKKGSFYNFKIEPFAADWLSSLIPAESPLIGKGKDFRKSIIMGEAKPVMEKTEGDSEETPELL